MRARSLATWMVVSFLLWTVGCGTVETRNSDYIDTAIDELLLGDDTALSGLSDVELDQLVDRLQEDGIYPDLMDQDTTKSATTANNLPYCGGSYWGSYASTNKGEVIEQKDSTSGLKYQVGPNCYMWSPDSDGDGVIDCGNPPDDFMLSFYFGYHSESSATLGSMLKWTSSDPWARTFLENLSFRLYEQNKGGGADNYNVYVCLDDYFFDVFPTFLMRKY